MADLNPLIRVRKHAVEQRQKFLAELYRQAEVLESQKMSLLEQLEKEAAAIEGLGAEFSAYFATFAQSVRERVEDIDSDRARLEQRIEKAREDMRNAFAELKKVEITQDRRDDAEEAEITRKETIELDDIGIDSFRRQAQD